MDVFKLREKLIADYADYIKSFISISDQRISDYVDTSLNQGLLWPDPLIQMNPSFKPGNTAEELVNEGLLDKECGKIFQKKSPEAPEGPPIRFHQHQEDAIRTAAKGEHYVLTTGTGSGKSLAYIVPIVNHVLKNRSTRKSIKAIVVYPMNALANSQAGELEKFLSLGYPKGKEPVTFARYTGQENDEQRQAITINPPDILLTNYVMLELILTRPYEKHLVSAAKGLQFLVLDELHTYRGRQGADVAMLIRRTRDLLAAVNLQCVGTSATLAGPGTLQEQQAEVAKVASLLFGSRVKPGNIIGETLQRVTAHTDVQSPQFISDLTTRLKSDNRPSTFEEFTKDPLSIWLEDTFGLTQEPTTGRLVRAQPLTISGKDGAATRLSKLTGLSEPAAAESIAHGLLAGNAIANPDNGFPAFAFRLHQFLSRGDTVYCSLEPEEIRHITVDGQQFVPESNREKLLYPMVFCRECGQPYYSTRELMDEDGKVTGYAPSDPLDRAQEESSNPGYLYVNHATPWPKNPEEVLGRLPDDWLEENGNQLKIRSKNKDDLPHERTLAPDGTPSQNGTLCHFIKAPFRFCLNCGVAYTARQRSDFSKLSTLGTEGRSTATTIVSLYAVQQLKNSDLPERARKLLSFTDNRQDASLQAGHFNDFVEVGLLRAGILKAAADAGPQGLNHDVLAQRVFDALDLPKTAYASDPEVRFQGEQDTFKALKDVLGYRIYLDLRRGWRITLPNLEQCGLLEIDYLSLGELCSAEDVWKDRSRQLQEANPETRQKILKTLLDFMRRELCIKVDYLRADYQETIMQRSQQRLKAPWAIDENERMESNGALLPRSRIQGDFGGNVYLSPRGGFGQYLRRPGTFPESRGKFDVKETQALLLDMLETLRIAGIVEKVQEPSTQDDVPAYQLVAASMVWKAGKGEQTFHDPIRVPRPPAEGGRTNRFFVNYYREIALGTKGVEAHEHTAQVQADERVRREDSFREGKLPILYCSPTMELGIDISELNVVHLRNIPPTPANYAQRSGRAGRSGSPALVLSYASTGNSHDQYFFKRQHLMVAGSVAPPRLDLGNEDLVRAHMHAIWLTETGQGLGTSLKEVLSVEGEDPSLDLTSSFKASVTAKDAVERAKTRAHQVLSTIREELDLTDWHKHTWVDDIFHQLPDSFERACDRWRSLYKAAHQQVKAQTRIILDASRSAGDKDQAKRLRREAESQLELLVQSGSTFQSDFYSYRYFASEGFLPGYNFPRLPLSAYIPGRKLKSGRDEFLSRARFMAISEFGPRAIVYHEGSKYVINKVILPVTELDENNRGSLTRRVKQCPNCGYIHPLFDTEGPDVCENCGLELGPPLRQLFRMENVVTKRRARINSDEEERFRLGYELRSGIRFAEKDGQILCRKGSLERDNSTVLDLAFGPSATLWRINLGWSRRARKQELGFVLDMERGYWAKNSQFEDDDDPMSPKVERVIPFVEDRRNCLAITPRVAQPIEVMASLQAALKNALQVIYQLEEGEIAAEPLPDQFNRNLILFYEASEGGAGVLRRLLDEPRAMAEVAREALRLCHYDPDTGKDLKKAPKARENCEAACYACMMSYSNQRDHQLLDRKLIRDILLEMAGSTVKASPVLRSRAEHLDWLRSLSDTSLEKAWLQFLEDRNLHLPTHAQRYVEKCRTRPDFFYENHNVAIYVDGPIHDFPDRVKRDREQTTAMEDAGYLVVRFSHQDDWEGTLKKYPYIFGSKK